MARSWFLRSAPILLVSLIHVTCQKCPSYYTIEPSWCAREQTAPRKIYNLPLSHSCNESAYIGVFPGNSSVTISEKGLVDCLRPAYPIYQALAVNMSLSFDEISISPDKVFKELCFILEAPESMIFKIHEGDAHLNPRASYKNLVSFSDIFGPGDFGDVFASFFDTMSSRSVKYSSTNFVLGRLKVSRKALSFLSEFSVRLNAVPDFRRPSQLHAFCYSNNAGYIQTPGWNGVTKYGGNTKSCVTIMVPENHVIMISFISLELNTDGDCTFDMLTMHTTADCRGKGDKICQLKDFEPTVSSSRVISFLFITESVAQKSGFRLFYTFHPNSAKPQKLENGTWNCSVPYYRDFQPHFLCSMEVFCSDGRDKRTCSTQELCGVNNIIHQADGKCYRVFKNNSEKFTWEEAAQKCESFRAHLVDLNTLEKWLSFLKMTAFLEDEIIFVGFKLAPPTAPEMYQFTYLWSDDTLAIYLNISLEKLHHVDKCGMMLNGHDPALSTVPCDKNRSAAFVCEIDEKAPARETFNVTDLLPMLNENAMKLTMATCFHNQTAHAFMACDVDMNCSAVDFVSSSYCAGNLFSPAVPFFTCATSSQRVPYSLVCDHRVDCCDSSDEDFCQFSPCVRREEFACRNRKQCIPREHRCDNRRHCVDESDEFICVTTWNPRDIRRNTVLPPARVDFTDNGDFIVSALNSTSCPDTHFRCPGKEAYCMPVYVLCNGVFDCPGKEDEADCDAYTCPGFYRCRASRICLHHLHLCDGVTQCPQRDDELMCNVTCPEGCTCYGHAFICARAFLADVYQDLRYLEASGTGMTLSDVSTNSLLVYLSLRHCGIASIGRHDFPNLQNLDLSYNKLDSVAIADLSQFNNLRNLSLAHNPLVSLDRLMNGNYIFVNLYDINFAGLSIPKLTDLFSNTFPNVQSLNLSFSGLDKLSKLGFQALKQLRDLDLRGCAIQTISPRVFVGLKMLNVIYTDNSMLCCPSDLPSGFDPKNCHAPVNEVSSCDALLVSEVFRIFLSFYALLSLLGNLGSFVYRTFVRKVVFKTGFDVFVTHLSVADFLMGVYLAIIGIADRIYYGDYRWNEITWRYSTACKVAGFLSLLSMEVSAFFICVITLERFLVIRYPLKKLNFRKQSAHIVCINLWITGLLLATTPFLPGNRHWDFYSQSGICVPLPITRKDFPGRDYAFGVMVGLNFILFVFIALGQLFIYWSTRLSPISAQNPSKKSRDKTVARRLIAVAVTDFLCWFPIGVLGILARSGVAIPGNVNVGMAIFVLPFNSALNPFLYTFNIVLEQHLQTHRARQPKNEKMEHPTVHTVDSTSAVGGVEKKTKDYTTLEAWSLFQRWLDEGVLPIHLVHRRVANVEHTHM